jgi:DNA ligase-1
MQRRDLLSRLSLGYLGCLATPLAPASEHLSKSSSPPALWLASPYQGNEQLSDYWVSEKYDGIRGYWDGCQLLSRSGKVLNPPAWFVEGWPSTPFEGELWAGLGQFEQAASVIQQKQAPDDEWRAIRFMVFDVLTPQTSFTERIALYQAMVKQIGKPWVQAVAQSQTQSHSALKTQLQKTVQVGGEGLVLHRGNSLYQNGRNGDVLKVKPHEDAEAKVVGYEAGQGKHAQRTGALWVETPQGLRFKLGSGLSDAQRENPPAVGQWVTYRYRGLTDKGVPRFANFVRIRPAVER